MRSSANADLEIRWLTEFTPLRIETEMYEELRVKDRELLLVDWLDNEEVYLGDAELFGTGPNRALVVRHLSQPGKTVLLGEEGSELLRLDIPTPSRIAEVPRAWNKVGGMCFISVLPGDEVTLLHWELGVLGLDDTLELRWRQDLEWNHQIVHLDEHEVWFDLMYESEDEPQRIGDQPWGLSVPTGRELFDRTPPSPLIRPAPLTEG